jgi:diguanylate cyclase (GGDEF)-like protein
VDESLPGHGPGRPVDGAEMTAVLDEFAATVTGDFKIGDILRQLAVSVTRVLAVDGAGVVTPDEDDRLLRLAFATPGPVHELESLQEALQNGPCLESHATGQVLNLGDVVEEGSWPAYQERAAQLGLSAVATIPLVARGERWGVLDLYRRERLPFSVAELTAATTLANLATSYLVVTEDRDTARQAQEELSHRAMHDTLTGLPVRWVFLEHLGHALERLPRHPGHVAVLFLDVDGLKHVNDTYGHPTGDRLLTTLVARMREALRPSDLLARIGGDEFVVLLDELADPEDVHDIVHRLLTGLAAPYRVDDSQVVTPSASIGVAHSSDPGVGSATLIAHADSAMYAAKRSGPGGYRVFDALDHAEDRAARSDRERLVAELRRAVAGDELEVHYQPIHEADGDAGATTLYAVEALLRWRHPDRGLLTAAAFIEVAEQSGLMPAIGERVMRAACQQLAAWDTAHGDRSPRHVFVNLSAPELADDDLPARARRILAETGLGPRRLTIEITETQLFAHGVTPASIFEELREHGCDLAIDDFGTGYSSLSRLTEVPAAILKIDQSFSRRIEVDTSAAAVVSAVVTLGERLGRVVIAEGVEDESTLQALRGLGVLHLQGYHLGRPAPADGIDRLLTGS